MARVHQRGVAPLAQREDRKIAFDRFHIAKHLGDAVWTCTPIMDTLMNSSSSHRQRSHADGLRIRVVGAGGAMQG